MPNLLDQYHGIDTSKDMRAIVVDRKDPRMQSRIAVVIPAIMPDVDPTKPKPSTKSEDIGKDGLKNTEISTGISSNISSSNFIWARPVKSHSGNSRVPYADETVYVFFEDGDPNKAYYRPYAPTVNGDQAAMETIGATADQFDPASKPNVHVIDSFKDGTVIYYNENSKTRQYGVKASNGTIFTIDNGESKKITLNTSGNYNLTIDETNKALALKTGAGHSVNMSDNDKKISIKTTGGHSIDMDDNGGTITISGSGGAKIILKGSNVSFN